MSESKTRRAATRVARGVTARSKAAKSPRKMGTIASGSKARSLKTEGPQQSAHAPHDATKFLRELGELLDGGVSIVPALVQLADRQSDVQLQSVMRDLSRKVRGGSFLSDALANHPQVFSALNIAAVRRSESDGTLASTLRDFAPGGARAATQSPPEQAEAEQPQAMVSVVEVAEFTREFAAMIDAGVSLVRSLAALEEKQTNESFKRVIYDINRGVQEGHSLSSAMARHPRVFDKSYIAAVRGGESNGTLSQALGGLTQTADILSFDQAVQFLGTSQPTLYRLLKQGDIKGLKVGRQWRFRKADLTAHMERRPATVTATELEGIDDELQFFVEAVRRARPETDVRAGDEKAETPAQDGESKVVVLTNHILSLALHTGASDIHVEPQHDGVWLRLRNDGVLHPIRKLPAKLLNPLLNRFKVMAEMSLDEKRLPQDGRIFLKWQDKDFEARVATCPTSLGESVVMQIVDKSKAHNSLHLLEQQMGPDDLKTLRAWLHRPNGLILVSGPAGTGKTTTLYSCLQEAGTPQNKVMTVEDPIGLNLPDIVQVQVNAKAGLGFAPVLRAFLRQDPDIVMVGAVPDKTVAELTLELALSGHLVLAQMDAGDAASAVTRLLELGVEPFLVSATLIGALSQRLARRICPDCKEEYKPQPELLARLGFDAKRRRGAKFHRGRGCERCRQSGFRGRVPLHELLSADEATTRLVESAPLSRLRRSRARRRHEDASTRRLEQGARRRHDG